MHEPSKGVVPQQQVYRHGVAVGRIVGVAGVKGMADVGLRWLGKGGMMGELGKGSVCEHEKVAVVICGLLLVHHMQYGHDTVIPAKLKLLDIPVTKHRQTALLRGTHHRIHTFIFTLIRTNSSVEGCARPATLSLSTGARFIHGRETSGSGKFAKWTGGRETGVGGKGHSGLAIAHLGGSHRGIVQSNASALWMDVDLFR